MQVQAGLLRVAVAPSTRWTLVTRSLAKKAKGKAKGGANAKAAAPKLDDDALADFGDAEALAAKQDKVLDKLARDLGALQLGRAHPAMLDSISVPLPDGSSRPLNSLAKVLAQGPSLLQVTAYDASLVTAVAKAIEGAELDLNPEVQGKVLRVPVPRVTREGREALAKQVREAANDAKQAVRAVRQWGMKRAKEGTKDETRRASAAVDAMHDQYISRVDELAKAKEKEVLAL